MPPLLLHEQGIELGQPNSLPTYRAMGSLLTRIPKINRGLCHLIQQEYPPSRILPHLPLGNILCKAWQNCLKEAEPELPQPYKNRCEYFLCLLTKNICGYSRTSCETCFHYNILPGDKIVQKGTSLTTNHWRPPKFIKE